MDAKSLLTNNCLRTLGSQPEDRRTQTYQTIMAAISLGRTLDSKNIRTTKHIKKLRRTFDANGRGHQRVPRASEGPWWPRLRKSTGPNACFGGHGPPTPFRKHGPPHHCPGCLSTYIYIYIYTYIYIHHLTTPKPFKAKYQRTRNWICQRSNAVHLFFLKLANM
jgi:hypothetical protein